MTSAESTVVLAYVRRDRSGPYNLRALVSLAVVRRDGLRHFGDGSGIRPGATYRLSDGRLPEFQAVTDEAGARAFLAENPYSQAVEIKAA